ncbi:MAG: hypothetical protein F4Z28_09755 [Gammaproteobacteria bacterium]|nr:hypothetical protein [Gammaproteobacteria bacterium]
MWSCVRAEELAGFLARESGNVGGLQLGDARSGKYGSRIPLYPAHVVTEVAQLETLHGETAPELPVVVVRSVGRRCEIVGIVTAFDLL